MEGKELTAHDFRLKKWSQILEARQNSDMNISEFCESKGISRYSFYYWQRKIREKALKDLSNNEYEVSSPNSWIEMTFSEKPRIGLEIEANSLRINVNQNTDMELLRKVCSMMRALS